MRTEEAATRLRRLRMRSMRRGMKEMDIILDGFATAQLTHLSEAEIATYDDLLSENDQEIYAWILGTAPAPAKYGPLIGKISEGLGARS